MKIIIYSILISLLICDLGVAHDAVSDGSISGLELGRIRNEREAIRLQRESQAMKLHIEREHTRLKQEELELDRQKMMLDACKIVYRDDPDEMKECVKDALHM